MQNRRSKKLPIIWLLLAAVLGVFCGCSADAKEDRNSMDLNVLGKIMVCMREEGSGTKDVFSENMSESASLEQVSYIAEGNDEVIAYVQNYPGAIGYVSKGKAVAAKGVSLVETDEKIARPFYLVHMGEQNDLERDFMTFLLGAGQEIIQTEYEPVKKTTSFLSNRAEGTLKIGGSSSVAGVMQLLADEYMKLNPNATIAVVTTDSADGVNGAISASYDFGMVSRELKSYEKELLDATKIAEDEIVLIVNENNPIRRMTMEEIGKIYDGTYTAWSNLKEEK